MDRKGVEAVIRGVNEGGGRYLIVDGFSVGAHGYMRYTADVDLILQLEEDNLRRAVAALAAEGYRPVVPVALEQFVDAEHRRQWIEEKKLTVFSLFSPQHPNTNVDLFVSEPLD